ncbi:MAG: hypothetical protein U5R31_05375 [Acidimicrobiia bacterium]|nr:hypothetical protein [Acidimicrobiia bacterium]
MPEPPRSDVGIVADLPYLVPVLEWLQSVRPHAVLTLDHTSELVSFGATPDVGTDVPPEHHLVDTEHESDLADRVREALPEGCELLAVLGPTERTATVGSLLRAALEVRGRSSTPPIRDGDPHVFESYAPDTDVLADEVVRQVATLTAEHTVEVLGRFREAAARGHAVETAPDVFAALREGAVTTLLVHDDPEDRQRLDVVDGAAVGLNTAAQRRRPPSWRARRRRPRAGSATSRRRGARRPPYR